MTIEHLLVGGWMLVCALRASYEWTQESSGGEDSEDGVDELRPITAHFYGKGPNLQAIKHLMASEYPDATCEERYDDSKPVRTRSLRIRMNPADAIRFLRQGLPWRGERSDIEPSRS